MNIAEEYKDAEQLVSIETILKSIVAKNGNKRRAK